MVEQVLPGVVEALARHLGQLPAVHACFWQRRARVRPPLAAARRASERASRPGRRVPRTAAPPPVANGMSRGDVGADAAASHGRPHPFISAADPVQVVGDEPDVEDRVQDLAARVGQVDRVVERVAVEVRARRRRSAAGRAS